MCPDLFLWNWAYYIIIVVKVNGLDYYRVIIYIIISLLYHYYSLVLLQSLTDYDSFTHPLTRIHIIPITIPTSHSIYCTHLFASFLLPACVDVPVINQILA
jgi:hypothetical protein